MKRVLLALRGRLWAERRQRVAALVTLCVAGALGHITIVGPGLAALESADAAEPQLKDEFRNRLQRAAELGPLQAQQEALQQTVAALEGPAAQGAGLAGLVSLARQHGLAVDLLEAEDLEVPGDFAALRTAQLRLGGSYVQFAGFAEALATQFPHVVLHNLVWQSAPERRVIVLDAAADTRRWLTVDELAAIKKRQAKDRRR